MKQLSTFSLQLSRKFSLFHNSLIVDRLSFTKTTTWAMSSVIDQTDLVMTRTCQTSDPNTEQREAGQTPTPEADIDTSQTQDIPGKDKNKKDGKSGLSNRARKRLIRQQRREGHGMKKKEKPQGKNIKEINFSHDNLAETDYYFENGLRKVYPYFFTYTAYAKGRWLGKTLMEVFDKEFRNATSESYRKSIESGRITINDKKVDLLYKYKDNDLLKNTVHRHELAVTSDPIKIVAVTDEVLAVNKPSSIPIHPCGRYRHNSLTYILAKVYGYKNLRTIYRLDRLTSGLMLFGRTEEKTVKMMAAVRDRQVQKEYLCRVVGEFPCDPIVCKEPLAVLSHVLGMFKVGTPGKESETSFERISYNGTTSVVKCRPHTGRTHQIRVHLQWLGYPIVNDPLYNSPHWGPNGGKNGDYGKSETELIDLLLKEHSRDNFLEITPPSETISQARSDSEEPKQDSTGDSEATNNISKNIEIPPPSQAISQTKSKSDVEETKQDNTNNSETTTTNNVSKNIEDSEPDAKKLKLDSDRSSQHLLNTFDSSKTTICPLCEQCNGISFRDPHPNELVMYLHALRNKGPEWDYSTSIPSWAQDDWQEEHPV